MKKITLSLLAISALFFTSCNNDDDSPSQPQLDVPATYSFERDGSSTVSFGGQTTRIKMADEIGSALMNFGNVTESQILAMYTHQEGANDFSDADLNASNKNIRSKVAASSDYFSTNSAAAEVIKNQFQAYISDQVTNVFPNYMSEASAGTAGQVVIGSRTRYVNAKGYENNQLFAKGLIGALMTDQALNNYLSTNVLDSGSNVTENNNGTTASGKPYTTMEHKFDEAYGYVYGGNVINEGNPNASESTHNNYLHKYIARVEGNSNFAGIADDIFNAFKTARAAIVAKQYDARDAQIRIIREKISTVIAVRAVYYLQAGKDKIAAGTRTASFHDLSEGLGFLYSMQFTHNPSTNQPYMSSSEVETAMNSILANDGLWTVSTETLDTVSQLVASKFNFTVADAR